jgi:hypothetical protein
MAPVVIGAPSEIRFAIKPSIALGGSKAAAISCVVIAFEQHPCLLSIEVFTAAQKENAVRIERDS